MIIDTLYISYHIRANNQNHPVMRFDSAHIHRVSDSNNMHCIIDQKANYRVRLFNSYNRTCPNTYTMQLCSIITSR